jgi:Raf kinase inhibitor-like YbhB/YbcL family protein
MTPKTTKIATVWLALAVTAALAAQTPPPQTPPLQQPQAGRGRGQGGGRGGIQIMSLTTTAWADGGQIPIQYSQAGPETSPPLAWDQVPEGVASFVLIVRDLDAVSNVQGGGTTDLLHWMVWNIPGTARGLPAGIPAEPELKDGSRQISRTGPYYRGPGAAAAGPMHHYVFELYALDAALDVPAVGASPDNTRAAVMTAMTGHIRGKATLVGLFKRSS